MELITSIILLVFAVLQIILFFKIWGMTNDVKEMKNNQRSREVDTNHWSKDFALKITLNQKEQAKEILYKEILSSKAFSELMRASTGNETYKQSVIEKINKEYAIFLNAIGEPSFTVDYQNKIYDIFK